MRTDLDKALSDLIEWVGPNSSEALAQFMDLLQKVRKADFKEAAEAVRNRVIVQTRSEEYGKTRSLESLLEYAEEPWQRG